MAGVKLLVEGTNYNVYVQVQMTPASNVYHCTGKWMTAAMTTITEL